MADLLMLPATVAIHGWRPAPDTMMTPMKLRCSVIAVLSEDEDADFHDTHCIIMRHTGTVTTAKEGSDQIGWLLYCWNTCDCFTTQECCLYQSRISWLCTFAFSLVCI